MSLSNNTGWRPTAHIPIT